MNNYYKGILIEYFAIIILFFKGYSIICRRYRNHFGEIDIITEKNNNLIAVEVKIRKNNITSENVSKHQINRIKNSLKYFVSKNPRYIYFNINIEIILFINYFIYKHYKEVEIYD